MARSTRKPDESTKPAKVKKVRWYHQLWQAYRMTAEFDKWLNLWLVIAFAGGFGVFLAIGMATKKVFYFSALGVLFALVVTLFVLSRRAETAAYAQIEGQPGASRAVIGTIRRGWTFPEEPVFIDAKTHDMVFRGVGRPGVVLVSEAPPHRAKRLLENERKKVNRLVANVPVHFIEMGNEPGQVPLRKIPGAMRRLRPELTKAEVSEVLRRLTAIGTVQLPIPKGVDPTRARIDRRAQRGR
jgi:hypothetical protein